MFILIKIYLFYSITFNEVIRMNKRADPPLLFAQKIKKTFTIGERSITVIEDISLEVFRGEFIVIKGNSGSGKTTLLTLLSALDYPTTGRVFLNNTEISALSEEKLAPLRNRQMGFVFQSFHLVPSLTALENVMFPAELGQNDDAKEMAERLIARVGLWPRKDNYPSQLSGGEKQRIALLRAVINRPQIIFADEPTGNLDSENGRAVLDLLIELRMDYDATLVLVTHSTKIAKKADRIVMLTDGRIQKEKLFHDT
jgi:putative ABC transport system ATP-binding protein